MLEASSLSRDFSTKTDGRPPYTIVLTHDIDVLSVVELPFGRTLAGFFYRCVFDNFARYIRGRLTPSQYWKSIVSASQYLPAKLKLCSDAWARSLTEMLKIERAHGVRSTLFFIPFSREPGLLPECNTPAPDNRAAHYRLTEYSQTLDELIRDGWEVGLHGINAWRSVDDARRELLAFKEVCPAQTEIGVRMHWLYRTPEMWKHLGEAGFSYDATFGWNDRVGFPGGRYIPFEGEGAKNLMVLPLNIQDGALFGREHCDLSVDEAWREVENVLNEARTNRAVVTILWHNNSFVAPRFWGEVYEQIICQARADRARISTAGQVISEFRREVNGKSCRTE
jgi:peptidoglycan/xylan/chitin deacetylase (PgdA/CDA1 family)